MSTMGIWPGLTVMGAALLLAGCVSIPTEDKSLLAAPVDCSSAERQIAALQQAKPSDEKRFMSAVQSVTPGGIAIGLLTEDYEDRTRVAWGSHTEEIEAKNASIRAECGLPPPASAQPGLGPTPPVPTESQP